MKNGKALLLLSAAAVLLPFACTGPASAADEVGETHRSLIREYFRVRGITYGKNSFEPLSGKGSKACGKIYDYYMIDGIVFERKTGGDYLYRVTCMGVRPCGKGMVLEEYAVIVRHGSGVISARRKAGPP